MTYTKEEARKRATLRARIRRGKPIDDPWGGQKQDMGKKYENLALTLLPNSSLTGQYRGSWDINWGNLRIDVKARNLIFRGTRFVYHFTRRKKSEATHFLCFCLDRGVVVKTFLFPMWFFGESVDYAPNMSNFRTYRVIEEMFTFRKEEN